MQKAKYKTCTVPKKALATLTFRLGKDEFKKRTFPQVAIHICEGEVC